MDTDNLSDILNEYYIRLWEERSESFRGIMVHPNDSVDFFDLNYSVTEYLDDGVKISISPEHVFHKDFKCYGIRLLTRLDDDGSVDLYGSICVYGYDLLQELKSHSVFFDFRGFFPLTRSLFYGYSKMELPILDIIESKNELWWHRLIISTILNHLLNDDPLLKSIRSLLEVSRYDRLPDRDEFFDKLDKLKIEESLKWQ